MTAGHSDEFQKASAWIRERAAENSVEEILADIRSRFETLYALVNGMTESELTSRAAPDEWSPIDALKHLVEWNCQVGEDILHVCLMGERPGNPAPEFEANREHLIQRAQESIESVWAHVSAADPGAFLELTWEHPFLGQFNWREWFVFLGVHAIDHTRQINTMHESSNA